MLCHKRNIDRQLKLSAWDLTLVRRGSMFSRNGNRLSATILSCHTSHVFLQVPVCFMGRYAGSQVWIHEYQILSHIWPVQIMAGEDESGHNHWAHRSKAVPSHCRTVKTSRALYSQQSVYSRICMYNVQRHCDLTSDRRLFPSPPLPPCMKLHVALLSFNNGRLTTRLSHDVTHASQ